MSARVISEPVAWRNLENFSNLKENQTPSLRYSDSLSDPTSWFQWACSFCCCYDRDIYRVLSVLECSTSTISARLSADSGLTPERVRIIRGTISNLEKTGAKFGTKEVKEIDDERREVEIRANMDLARSCTEMANALKGTFRTNSDLSAKVHARPASFDDKKDK
ncbi:MAG TPA: hypothetical protein ENH96_04255 [Chlamydiae bacterium]|nr:hypothetical protein [Chlamydiota bacterium]